jgi:hypothetical protein
MAAMKTAAVETTVPRATVEATVTNATAEAVTVEAMMNAIMEPPDPHEGGAAEIVRIAIVSWVIRTVTVSVIGVVTVSSIGIAICPSTSRKQQGDCREQQYLKS